MSTASQMFQQLLHAPGQSKAARTVELFGWLILAESPLMLLRPHWAATLLHLPALDPQAANYFSIVGLLIGGLGMLYVTSGRLSAAGFVFASLLDRPLVPFVMAALWWWGIVPGPLAAAFALQDWLSFLWTLSTWHAEQRASSSA
jgi:hypothetical protein